MSNKPSFSDFKTNLTKIHQIYIKYNNKLQPNFDNLQSQFMERESIINCFETIDLTGDLDRGRPV